MFHFNQTAKRRKIFKMRLCGLEISKLHAHITEWSGVVKTWDEWPQFRSATSAFPKLVALNADT